VLRPDAHYQFKFGYHGSPATIAHAILAILLESEMAATFVGRRINNAVSQGRCQKKRLQTRFVPALQKFGSGSV